MVSGGPKHVHLSPRTATGTPLNRTKLCCGCMIGPPTCGFGPGSRPGRCGDGRRARSVVPTLANPFPVRQASKYVHTTGLISMIRISCPAPGARQIEQAILQAVCRNQPAGRLDNPAVAFRTARRIRRLLMVLDVLKPGDAVSHQHPVFAGRGEIYEGEEVEIRSFSPRHEGMENDGHAVGHVAQHRAEAVCRQRPPRPDPKPPPLVPAARAELQEQAPVPSIASVPARGRAGCRVRRSSPGTGDRAGCATGQPRGRGCDHSDARGRARAWSARGPRANARTRSR